MVECEYVDGNTNKGSVAGFNRYMVECELHSAIKDSQPKQVLIDTWWNVNE